MSEFSKIQNNQILPYAFLKESKKKDVFCLESEGLLLKTVKLWLKMLTFYVLK